MPPLDGSHSYVKLNLEFRANSGAVDDGKVTLTLPDHIRGWDEGMVRTAGPVVVLNQ